MSNYFSKLPAIFLTTLGLMTLNPCSAEEVSAYPSKPIRLIVGFATGGISDVIARALSAKITEQTGQAVIVENKPGAGTTIAADFVSKASPDGYTIFLQDMTTHAINASLYKKLSYDTLKDFSPITLVASTPLMLVTNPSLKVNNLKEFIALAKQKSDSLSYSSSGNGAVTHLAAETFNRMVGIQPVHVPFKGSSASTQAVLAGDVAFTFSSMPPAITLVQSKKLTGLGVTTLKRISSNPDVPTLSEAGLSGYDFVLYNGVIGPKGMPADLVKKINGIFANAVHSPEMKQIFTNLGADPITNTPTEFSHQMAEESLKMAKAVKISGAQID
ncbi:tripartite tricarboxylate transporter substrate binding protein [Polynucleobacter kasalickyi]|uniref:Tripartite-type tricarboxylate transporter, receptor component TctC n=1 Tax=Polynucleobacter kasalickyi TaxID=1938817 RepID=A0A1W1Z0E8_9BURK|nr:tripartite tricarboxylate transporter substrate binding protein [Polynucleobacter kasalickyi]SMC41438.1 Tripartite-type tricarboxylate transporter, receptor component TctC [Polynucleobacter kasalickyi]